MSVVAIYGQGDYDHLNYEMQQRLCVPLPIHKKLIETLKPMFRLKQVWFMDKQTGLPMEVSGTIGLDQDKLLLFCER